LVSLPTSEKNYSNNTIGTSNDDSKKYRVAGTLGVCCSFTEAFNLPLTGIRRLIREMRTEPNDPDRML